MKLTKHFLDALYLAMLSEYDTEVMCSLGTSMKECLDEIES